MEIALTGGRVAAGGEGKGLPRICVDDGVIKSEVPREKSDTGGGAGSAKTTSLILSCV